MRFVNGKIMDVLIQFDDSQFEASQREEDLK